MLRDIKQKTDQRVSADGILQFYDTTRSKWLSSDRSIFTFSANHLKAKGERWLRLSGDSPSNTTSYKIPRGATVVSISIQAMQPSSGTFRIFAIRSGVKVVLYTETLTASDSVVVDNLNIDVLEGDNLSALLMSGEFDYPVLTLEIAWR